MHHPGGLRERFAGIRPGWLTTAAGRKPADAVLNTAAWLRDRPARALGDYPLATEREGRNDARMSNEWQLLANWFSTGRGKTQTVGGVLAFLFVSWRITISLGLTYVVAALIVGGVAAIGVMAATSLAWDGTRAARIRYSPSYAFRALKDDLEKLYVTCHHRPRRQVSEPEMQLLAAATRRKLRCLGIAAPLNARSLDIARSLAILAEAGKLEEARKRFPLPDATTKREG